MISFVLTVLNRSDNLSKFFAEMPRQSKPHEFVIVDNGSQTITVQLERWLVQNYKPAPIKLIENGENLGFGVGNNIGVTECNGDIIVLTQPDVSFRGDVTVHLEGLWSRCLYGHQYLGYDTGWNRFGKVVVPYLTGYFLACTRGTWIELGGFDPIYYPADFEDVDLSYRAVRKGMELKTLDVPISHSSFGSTWAQFPNREQVTKANRLKFAEKWGLSVS